MAVQTKSISGYTTTPQTLTFDTPVTAGNLIVVAVAWIAAQTLTSVSDGTNTYVVIDAYSATDFLTTLYLKNVPGGSTTLTITWSGNPGANGFVLAHEIAGRDTVAPLDQHTIQEQVNPGTGTDAVTSGSVTTLQNGESVFGVTYDRFQNLPSIAAGTGYVKKESISGQGSGSEDRVQTSAGAIAATFTAGGSSNFITAIATFKAAPAQGSRRSRWARSSAGLWLQRSS